MLTLPNQFVGLLLPMLPIDQELIYEKKKKKKELIYVTQGSTLEVYTL